MLNDDIVGARRQCIQQPVICLFPFYVLLITYAITTALTGTSVTSAGVVTAGSTTGTAVVTVTATLPDDSTVTDTVSVVVA